MPINAELVSSCLAPISPDAPAGADLRYDTRLDAIKEARREENLPGAERKVADWNSVVTQCSALLQKETKDLQLAAWLSEALMRRQGFGGLHTGVAITRGLIEQFWDTVFPLPEDGDLELRVGPLEWMGNKLALPVRLTPVLGRFSAAELESVRAVPSEGDAKSSSDARAARDAAIEEGRLTPEDLETDTAALTKVNLRVTLADIDAALAEIVALEKVSDEKFGRDAPSFGSLRTALDEPRRAVQALLAQKLELDPDPVEEAPVEGENASGDAGEADGPLSPEPTSARDAAQRIGVVARWLRQHDRANPAPYLLLRGFRWGELMARAPELDPRLLEAPPTALRTRLRTLYLDAKWPELLEQGESLMATTAGRGWLDLQRYVLTAAVNLGGEYQAVASALRQELRSLLRALPQLPRMTLMDETPTANDETRAWIEQDVLPNNEADANAAAASDDADALPSDGAELVSAALVDDLATAQQGGLARARTVHPAARSGPDAFGAAMAEVRAGRPHRAIELLTTELNRDPSPRGRFLRQTQIAYIMVEAGLFDVAEPILQQLIEQIDEQKLERWESGPLVAQPLALMHRVLTKTDSNNSEQERLYLRVCRLDPIQALALKAG
jgi:type VI secretion system protein ImpA